MRLSSAHATTAGHANRKTRKSARGGTAKAPQGKHQRSGSGAATRSSCSRYSVRFELRDVWRGMSVKRHILLEVRKPSAGKGVREMRTFWRKCRRVLSAMWLEIRREDPGDSGDGTGTAECRAIEAATPRKVGKVTAARGDVGHDADVIVRRNRNSRGGPLVAVEARSSRAGLATRDELAKYTLVAIRRAMAELEEKGVRPDAIILEPHEFKMLLTENFDWEDGDPIPSSVTLFGLPVRVQR
jgi:hypothetical protein